MKRETPILVSMILGFVLAVIGALATNYPSMIIGVMLFVPAWHVILRDLSDYD